jgi:Lon protease-like protein
VGKAPPAVASVGCEAVIRDFVQQDNGLLGIRVEGVRRFRVAQTEVRKDQLLVGQVHWLPEQADSPLIEQDDDLLALLVALGEHPMVEALDMPRDVDGRQALANQLAYLLPFMEEDKLDLLAMDSPQLRLEAIQTLLERIQGELFA